MRISIELDGNFWLLPEFFGEFGNLMKSRGHEVGILTGHSYEIEKEDMRLLWERAKFVPSFFYNRNEEDLKMEMVDWKSNMIQLKGIDLHFDHDANQIKYFVNIPTIMILQMEPMVLSKYEKEK